MIKIDKTWVGGFEGAIRGMRNPFMSQDKSDSSRCDNFDYKDSYCEGCAYFPCEHSEFIIGEADMALCKKLIRAGSEHRKFLRMIHVQFDIRMPRYFATQLDTYKVGTTKNSSSTMHLITKSEVRIDDFEGVNNGVREMLLNTIIPLLNQWIYEYNDTSDDDIKDSIFTSIKQLLPESYMQMATYDMTYETLLNIYRQRKNHRLSEWHEFCDWIESLPYMKDFLCLQTK